MFIVANEDGSINRIGSITTDNAVEYTGVEPEDFGNTFALGKYKFINGQIVEVEGWVAPTPPELPGDPGQEKLIGSGTATPTV